MLQSSALSLCPLWVARGWREPSGCAGLVPRAPGMEEEVPEAPSPTHLQGLQHKGRGKLTASCGPPTMNPMLTFPLFTLNQA